MLVSNRSLSETSSRMALAAAMATAYRWAG